MLRVVVQAQLQRRETERMTSARERSYTYMREQIDRDEFVPLDVHAINVRMVVAVSAGFTALRHLSLFLCPLLPAPCPLLPAPCSLLFLLLCRAVDVVGSTPSQCM